MPEDEAGAHKEGQKAYRSAGVVFVSDAHMLPTMLLLSLVLAPIHRLMHRTLEVSSAEWEMEQQATMALGGDRDTLLGLCAELRHEREADASLRAMLLSTDKWVAFVGQARCVAMQSSAYQLLSMVGCCLRFYVMDHHKSFPIAAFGWLLDPEGISAAYDKVPCKKMLDRWTRSWCAAWATSEGLDSAAAKADLSATRALCFLDNAGIEARHAAIRREVVALGTQTHAGSFDDISSRFVLRSIRQRCELERRFAPALDKVAQPSAQGAVGPEGLGGSASSDGPAPKRQRGGGGPYRAWLSERTRGTPLGIATPGLREEYEQLSDVEKARFRELGREGTRAHQAGGRGFGPSKMEVERALQRQRRSHEDVALRQAALASLKDRPGSRPQEEDALRTARSLPFDDGLGHVVASVRRKKQLQLWREAAAKAALVDFKPAEALGGGCLGLAFCRWAAVVRLVGGSAEFAGGGSADSAACACATQQCSATGSGFSAVQGLHPSRPSLVRRLGQILVAFP